jgi:hypothetical protein
MPLADIATGRDEIFAHFKTAWDAQVPPIPQVVYQDSSVDEDLASGKVAWVRPMIEHTIMGQSTLSGETGNKRFQRLGFFIVEVRTPAGDGMKQNAAIGDLLLTAFEGQNGGPNGEITFERARYNEVGKDGAWFLSNFIVEFDYSTIR